jgi:hypothetical protein
MSYLLLIAVLMVLALILCLLLIPFHLLIDVRMDGPLVSGWYGVAWFGLPLHKRAVSCSAYDIIRWQGHREKPAVEDAKAIEKGHISLMDLRAIQEILPALIQASRELFRSMRREKFICHLRWGSGDPADTAFYTGCLWPLIAALNSLGANLSLQPCFEEEVLEGSLFAELKASLIGFIVPLLRALCKDKVRRLLLQTARGNRR